MSEQARAPLQRVASIDRFRGLVIFCMIIFQFAEHFPSLGVVARLAEHSPHEGAVYILPNLALADLIAPVAAVIVAAVAVALTAVAYILHKKKIIIKL